MTRYYAVVLEGERATFFAHVDEEQASEQEHALMCKGYESQAIGNIDGDAYLIVYRKPAEGTGTQADPHRCRGCPECAVVFDSEGIHGHVPDRNSKTCQSCERYKEMRQ